jgi:hypothetical protein
VSKIASETTYEVSDLLPKPSLRVAAASTRPESSARVGTDGVITGVTSTVRTSEGEGEGEGEGVDLCWED